MVLNYRDSNPVRMIFEPPLTNPCVDLFVPSIPFIGVAPYHGAFVRRVGLGGSF